MFLNYNYFLHGLSFLNHLLIEIALDGTYFYSEPSRYIFPGAEVYKDSNDSKDCNNSSDDDSGNVQKEFMIFPINNIASFQKLVEMHLSKCILLL